MEKRNNGSEITIEKSSDTILLAGDFNVDFSSDRCIQLVEFLRDELELTMNNYRTDEPTTKYGTTIDAVFSRYIQSKIFISYFSYHKPIISVIHVNNNNLTHGPCISWN